MRVDQEIIKLAAASQRQDATDVMMMMMMTMTTMLAMIMMMMFSCPDSKGRWHLMAVGRTMVLVIGDGWEKV